MCFFFLNSGNINILFYCRKCTYILLMAYMKSNESMDEGTIRFSCFFFFFFFQIEYITTIETIAAAST